MLSNDDLHEWIVAFIADAEGRYGPVWEDAQEAVEATTTFIDDNLHILEMAVEDAVDYWYMFQI